MDKPGRLLTEARVLVRRVTGELIEADVQGDHDRYRVVRDPGGWSCDCPSWHYRHRCSHVDAVRHVTVKGTQP